jgi:two-component system, NtrC family, response regulator HydG
MITAYGDIELAIKAIKFGAIDFVLKPWENEKLLATVSAAYKLSKAHNKVEKLESSNKILSDSLEKDYIEFIGNSPSMDKVMAHIDKVAATDANVLILGENGTGKELVARAIHRQSLRKNESFIKVDLGAIPETLFESELFGHKKGSFTDAREDRTGRFEVANQGTLFLDEIGNLSFPLQSKLLTVIQSKQVIKVGANIPVNIDIRLVCATNMPLYQMANENRFRKDLLYRINTVEINIPPLRERREDIPLLVEHYLSVFSKKYLKSGITVGNQAMKALLNYSWPGNVRELQHALERAVILSDSNVLQAHDFPIESGRNGEEATKAETLNLEEMERAAIKEALVKFKGNISHAAKELGLTRAALYRRLEKYGI